MVLVVLYDRKGGVWLEFGCNWGFAEGLVNDRGDLDGRDEHVGGGELFKCSPPDAVHFMQSRKMVPGP